MRLCRELAGRQGWTVAEVYTDHALSGASALRPGYQRLLEDVRYPSGGGRGGEGLTARDQAAALALADAAQCHGRSWSIRLAGWSGRRASPSASQAWGSMPFSLAVSIRV